MRVLVWNMNKQTAAWSFLREHAADFDGALLQETRDPRDALAGSLGRTRRPLTESMPSGPPHRTR